MVTMADWNSFAQVVATAHFLESSRFALSILRSSPLHPAPFCFFLAYSLQSLTVLRQSIQLVTAEDSQIN